VTIRLYFQPVGCVSDWNPLAA
ncbi:unnamed protein product, partial [Allacma fusca]